MAYRKSHARRMGDKGSMKRSMPFRTVTGAHVQRSHFNLSHTKLFTCDMGQCIPILVEDVVPSDYFRIGANVMIRFEPLTTPTMHEINVYAHYFFVPKRLLDDLFEDYYTKGVTGDYEGTLEDYMDNVPAPETKATHMAKYSLWDYFGQAISKSTGSTRSERGFSINAFYKQVYNFIYNEYLRDNDYVEPVDINQGQILNCAWEKDYFTAARKKQQRGTSPSFPVTGLANVIATNFNSINEAQSTTNFATQPMRPVMSGGGTVPSGAPPIVGTAADVIRYLYPPFNTNPLTASPGNTALNAQYMKAEMSNVSLFNINDLREAVQLQLWMEINQRGGVRFTEFLRMMFGVSPNDDRLDRPEYIGGLKQPIIISEVLQTSATANEPSPQGNLAGHGISIAATRVGSYLVKEPGIIMGIMSVRPRTVYYQGVDKMFTHETPFDEVFPTFTHLSEKAINRFELMANMDGNGSGLLNNKNIEGFIPMYDEYRYRKNMVCADMRDMFDYWHLARQLSPNVHINKDFITMDLSTPKSTDPYVPNPGKRIFMVQNEPGLVIHWGNAVIATRPLPMLGNPGRLDHA